MDWTKSKDRVVTGPAQELLTANDVVLYLALHHEEDDDEGEGPVPALIQQLMDRGLLPPPVMVPGTTSPRWTWMDVVCLSHLLGATTRMSAAPAKGGRSPKK